MLQRSARLRQNSRFISATAFARRKVCVCVCMCVFLYVCVCVPLCGCTAMWPRGCVWLWMPQPCAGLACTCVTHVARRLQLEYLGDKGLKVRGLLRRKKLPGPQQSLNMMGPGGGMMEGMKNNMMFMFSNMIMIGWISHFFSGFVLGAWCCGWGRVAWALFSLMPRNCLCASQ